MSSVKCDTCGAEVTSFKQVGVRAVAGAEKSGLWRFAQPCGHRVNVAAAVVVQTVGSITVMAGTQIVAPSSGTAMYNGGPIWQADYKWQNIYWGSYWNAPTPSSGITPIGIRTAVIDILSDSSYWGGLKEYNVNGPGTVLSDITISTDPPASIDDSQIGPRLQHWIQQGVIPELGQQGAYNIFFPPGTTVTLQGSANCQVYCDYHSSDGVHFYTVEPYPCTASCNQCSAGAFDTLTQGLSEELVELATDMNPGTGWVIGNGEICDFCLPPDELLQGDNKTIAEYRTGDRVVGSTGLEKVQRTYERPFSGELVEIRAEGILPFRVTPNHPILVIHERHHLVRKEGKFACGRSRYSLELSFDDPSWKRASDLSEKHGAPAEGDCLVVPMLKGMLEMDSIPLQPYMKRTKYYKTKGLPFSFPLTNDTAWLLGMYVAEGSNNGVHQLSFTLASHETAIKERIVAILAQLGYRAWARNAPGEECTVVYFNSRPLLRMLKEVCGDRAHRKSIPDMILHNKNEELLRAFLDGYAAGDGCITRDKKFLVVVTTSKLLIQQLQLAYARLGRLLKVGKTRTGKKETIQGRVVDCHDQYTGRLNLEPRRQEFTRVHGDFFYVPIRKLKRTPYSGKVYNISTADHTYLVSNAVVHNCDSAFVCNQISTGEYVNAWYSNAQGKCWGKATAPPPPENICLDYLVQAISDFESGNLKAVEGDVAEFIECLASSYGLSRVKLAEELLRAEARSLVKRL